MDTETLRAFTAFAEELNFTRAARTIGISQPALHVKIRRLGEALGVELYTKRGSALHLTSHGDAVLSYAQRAIEREELLIASLRGEEFDRPIVLAAGEGTFLYLIDDAVRQFSSRRDLPQLQLMTGSAGETVEAVRHGIAHVGVCPNAVSFEGTSAVPVARIGMKAVATYDHPLARRSELSIKDLDGCGLVVPPRGASHRDVLERLMSDAAVELRPAVEARGWNLMLHFASRGLGIAVVNDHCPDPPGTVGVPVTDLPTLTYSVLTQRDLAHPAAGTLLELVLSCTAERRD